MADAISYAFDEIIENQRRDPLKLDFSKSSLQDHDPSPWVDNNSRTCTPSSFPMKEGFVSLKPWVYIINEPYTDNAGWIYKTDFTSRTESVKPTLLTNVRYRKWRRVCVEASQLESATKLLETEELDQHRHNAYNIEFIERFFDKQSCEFSLQLVEENIRFKQAGPQSTSYSELADPPKWTFLYLNQYVKHKLPKNLVDLNDNRLEYIPATVVNLAIPFHNMEQPEENIPFSRQSPSLSYTDDWVALAGWNFFIDFNTDDTGWQYGDSFYEEAFVGKSAEHKFIPRRPLHWSRYQSEACVKRRIWCRILVHYRDVLKLRGSLSEFILANSRGIIKRDSFYKQGHFRANWKLRNFDLTDQALAYKTTGNVVRGAVSVADKFVHYNDFGHEESDHAFGFRLSDEFLFWQYYPIYFPDLFEENARQSIHMYAAGKKKSGKAADMSNKPKKRSMSLDQAELAKLYSEGGLGKKQSFIWNSQVRRMHRTYLNMSTASVEQREVLMDVMRHQIWLLNLGTPLQTCDKYPDLKGYRLYDVDGSPPTDCVHLYLTLTVDMLLPVEHRPNRTRLLLLEPLCVNSPKVQVMKQFPLGGVKGPNGIVSENESVHSSFSSQPSKVPQKPKVPSNPVPINVNSADEKAGKLVSSAASSPQAASIGSLADNTPSKLPAKPKVPVKSSSLYSPKEADLVALPESNAQAESSGERSSASAGSKTDLESGKSATPAREKSNSITTSGFMGLKKMFSSADVAVKSPEPAAEIVATLPVALVPNIVEENSTEDVERGGWRDTIRIGDDSIDRNGLRIGNMTLAEIEAESSEDDLPEAMSAEASLDLLQRGFTIKKKLGEESSYKVRFVWVSKSSNGAWRLYWSKTNSKESIAAAKSVGLLKAECCLGLASGSLTTSKFWASNVDKSSRELTITVPWKASSAKNVTDITPSNFVVNLKAESPAIANSIVAAVNLIAVSKKSTRKLI